MLSYLSFSISSPTLDTQLQQKYDDKSIFGKGTALTRMMEDQGFLISSVEGYRGQAGQKAQRLGIDEDTFMLEQLLKRWNDGKGKVKKWDEKMQNAAKVGKDSAVSNKSSTRSTSRDGLLDRRKTQMPGSSFALDTGLAGRSYGVSTNRLEWFEEFSSKFKARSNVSQVRLAISADSNSNSTSSSSSSNSNFLYFKPYFLGRLGLSWQVETLATRLALKAETKSSILLSLT